VVSEGWRELVGFPYSPVLLAQLDALDLQAAAPRARRVLVAGSDGPRPDFPELVEHVSFPAPRIWLEDADRALVPKAGLDSIVTWLSEVYA
jgi:hypothetical protein